MGCERGFWRVRDSGEPFGEISHESGDFRRRRKLVPSRICADVAGHVGISSSDTGIRTLHDKAMKVAHVALLQRRLFAGEFAHVPNRVIVVKSFQVILEWLTADSNALLDHKSSFDGAERVPFDRVRGVSDLYVVVTLKTAQGLRCEGSQCVQTALLIRD